MAEGKDPA